MIDPDKEFELWKEDYGLAASHAYTRSTEIDCKAAFLAGRASRANEVEALRANLADKGRRMAAAAKALGFEP